ncbi:E3 ubiquitin-protein ligase TRIM71 [Stylophora pistillata]|uniref:E3 ubiquitin-protein ligase TRIM71 n=1 Tax=Stylophora pistillata TaxID=50429 RepID=A0A2B4R647_STYPI|nr:E3 ubiquitin-protein ligase TRIM71 [Stylophora pistillata]
MDIKTLLDNLHEEVSCSVCMTTFTEPKILPCLHSFCLHCLNGILRISGRHHVFLCPECRREVQVPSSGTLKDLPTNFRINSLLDVLAIKECHTTGVKCGNCDKKQCYHERDCVMVEIKTQQGHDCATELRVQDNKDGSYKVRYFLKDTGKCQLSVKANGEDIRGSPFNVLAKPRQFRPLLSFGKGGSSPGMLAYPNGVAVNKRDEILVTDNNGRVQVFSSDGIYLRSFGRRGDKQGEFNFPTGIAHDKNKNIIVVDTNNHRVQLFNDQGEYLKQFGGKGNLDHQLSNPFGLSVDGNGNIIVPDMGNNCIKTFSSNGQFLYKFGEGEAFTAPLHCIQYNKHLKVSDSGEHCIKVFDINGDFLYKFGNKGNGDGQFDFPRVLSVNKAGHLMVCDRDNHRVQVFELSGKFVTKYGKIGVFLGIIKVWTVRVQHNKDGSYKVRYFLKDTGKCQLSVKANKEHIRGSPFTFETKPRQFRPLLSFGKGGSSVGMFRCPYGVAVNERDEIAVTDTNNHRVQVFSSDGTYLRSFGKEGDEQGREFHCPTDIAHDKKKNIIMVDTGNHRVQLFNDQGEYLSQFGGEGNLDHQLSSPFGLSVDGNGNIIVADTGNKCIKTFSSNGQFLYKLGQGEAFTAPFHCIQYNKHLIIESNPARLRITSASLIRVPKPRLPLTPSFCLHCLNGIPRTSGRHDVFLCPECRREVQVPSSGNLKDLPTNFRINSLLDVLAIKECHTTGVKCGNCDKCSRHSSYCFQCCAFWCDECITVHNMIKANEEHRVLALKDFENQDIEDVLKRPAFCQLKHHEKEELKFFCKNCDVAICNSCVATIHDGHAKILLEDAASERKLQVQSLIESQKEKIEQKKNQIADLERQCNCLEARADAVKRDIHRLAENMFAAIETKKKEL